MPLENNSSKYLIEHIDEVLAISNKRINETLKKVEKVSKVLDDIDKRADVLIKSVEDIKVVKDELSNINNSKEPKVIVQSVEYKELLKQIKLLIEETVVVELDKIFKDSDDFKSVERKIRELYEEQNKKIEILNKLTDETRGLNQTLLDRISITSEFMGSVNLLTDFLRDFVWELKKIFPTIEIKKYKLIMQEEEGNGSKKKEVKEKKEKRVEEKKVNKESKVDNKDEADLKQKNSKIGILGKIRKFIGR